MKDYYQKSMRALQLAGMSTRTQQLVVRVLHERFIFPPFSP